MFSEKIQENVPLAPYTTFKIGGPASYFVEVARKEELVAAVDWAKRQQLPYFVLGGGSNLLINDKGYKGLVIHLLNDELAILDGIITAGAGLALEKLVTASIEGSLAGLVWASGIPGTVGGAVRGNAGAYGGEIKDNILWVEYYDVENGEFIRLDKQFCDFNYRSSGFKLDARKIIWRAAFGLTGASSEALLDQSVAIIAQRQAKLPPEASAGSVFKNLLVSDLTEASEAIESLIRSGATKGGKLAVGTLLESLALKGFVQGGASISKCHANVIVNNQKASASDVLALIKLIKDKVRQEFDLELVEEIYLLGF